AAYADEGGAVARLKEEIAELDRAAEDKELEIEAIAERARQGIARARMTLQKTEMIELPPEPGPPPGEGDPPEPARIPEPYPPPDEGTPPEPARIPEPYPPPDETTPPQPEREQERRAS